MNPITTLEPQAHTLNIKQLLSKNGYSCRLVQIESGEEWMIERAPQGEDRLLFVVDGEARVRSGEIVTMLSKNEAHLLNGDDDSVVTTAGERPTKLFHVEVPPRRVLDAPLYSFESGR